VVKEVRGGRFGIGIGMLRKVPEKESRKM